MCFFICNQFLTKKKVENLRNTLFTITIDIHWAVFYKRLNEYTNCCSHMPLDHTQKKNDNQQFVFKHRSSNSHFVRKTMSRKAYVRMRCKPIIEQWHNFCVQMTLANTFRTKKNSCETKYKKQQLKLFIGATTWSTNVSVPITTKTFHWFQNHFEMINLTQLQFEVLKAFV